MALEPHLRHAAKAITEWLEPPWRKRRAPHQRATAWAVTGGALTCYLFGFLAIGHGASVGMVALYALPCLVAGWAFGASGGVLAALLGLPIHAWLYSSGIVPTNDHSSIGAVFGVTSALAVAIGVGTARDLRERLRERGHELAQSEDRYRQLVDNSPEGVLVHERGVIVFANPSMARLAGILDARLLIGRTVVTLAPFEDREALAMHFLFASEMRAARCVQARLAKPDGEIADVVMTTMPIAYRGARANLVLVRESALVRAPAKLDLRPAASALPATR